MIRAFRDYLAEHPDSAPARLSLLGALRKSGDYDGAIAVCKESIDLRKKHPSVESVESGLFTGEYMIATLLMEKNDVPGAILHLERLTHKDAAIPDYLVGLVYQHLSEQYQKQGNMAKAKWATKQATKQYWLQSVRTDGYRFENCELGTRLTKLFKRRGW